METQLTRYEHARIALAEAHRIDEVKSIRDKAEALAAYARQAKDSELIQYATEIKVRAERRCGEMLRDTKETGERAVRGEPVSQMSHRATSAPPTLDSMGITRDESSRYQKLAAMPDEHFETAVATAKATAGEVTTAHMLRAAAAVPAPQSAVTQKGKVPAAERAAVIRDLLSKGHNTQQIAGQMGISEGHLSNIIAEQGIKRTTPKGATAKVSGVRVITETIDVLVGVTQGVELAKRAGVTMPKAQAAELLGELRTAMKAVRWMETKLKEIANG